MRLNANHQFMFGKPYSKEGEVVADTLVTFKKNILDSNTRQAFVAGQEVALPEDQAAYYAAHPNDVAEYSEGQEEEPEAPKSAAKSAQKPPKSPASNDPNAPQ